MKFRRGRDSNRLIVTALIVVLAAFSLLVFDVSDSGHESAESGKQSESREREIERNADSENQSKRLINDEIVIAPELETKDWSDAETVTEIVEPTSGNPFISIRRRIVRVEGFTDPVLLEENLITDPVTNEVFTEVRKSALANKLVISSDLHLDRTRVENALESSDWHLEKIIGSGYTAVVNSSKLEIDTVDNGIRELDARFAEFEGLQVEPDIILYSSTTVPDDEYFDEAGMWGLDSSGDNDVDAPEGWDAIRDSSAIVVAIVDSGIRSDHEDLAGNMWQNPSEIPNNGIDDDENGYVDDIFGVNVIDSSLSAEDDGGHGTHVAGIVGAVGNNGKGVVGVAWNARLMAVKSMNASGRGTSDWAVEAIDYATANGAKIINASWGGEGTSLSIERAIERAGESGVFVVVSAGNEGEDIDKVYYTPASIDLPNVITVASTNVSGELSPFSNYGIKAADLAAPGSGILSTDFDSSEAYSIKSGTSMAAPLVTGILALNISLRPEDSMDLHVDRLIFSSKKRSALSRFCRSQGIVNLASSLALERIPKLPVIDIHSDLSLFRVAGGSVEMSVVVVSELPISYEWIFNDTILDGENFSKLELESISEANEGVYKMTARNDDGEASIEFDLNVLTHNPSLADGLDAGPDVSVLAEKDDQWSIGIDPNSRGGDHIEGIYTTTGKSNDLRAIVKGPGLLRFLWKLEGVPEGVSRPECRVGESRIRLFAPVGEWHLGESLLVEDRDYEIVWSFGDSRIPESNDGRLIIDYLSVDPPDQIRPIIYKHPDDVEAKPFDDVNMYTYVSGANLVFDWYKDGALEYPSSSRDLSIRRARVEDEGSYHLIVSNESGSDTSRSAILEIDESQTPAHFTELTRDFVGVEGDRMDITLDHSGSPGIVYKWYRDQHEIPGENGPILSFNSLKMAHAGNYQMLIENPYGGPRWSSSIWLRVIDRDLSPSSVLGHDFSYTIELVEGDELNFDYWIGNEFVPIEYQWYRNGVPMEGQTNKNLLIERVVHEDSGVYFIEIGNERGTYRGGVLQVIVQFDPGDALDYSEVTWELNGQEDRGWKYTQREVSFDGDDAIEFARRYEPEEGHHLDDGGFSEFVGAFFTGPLNLSAYWKRTSNESWFEAYVGNYPSSRGGILGRADRVAVFEESGEVGDWQQSVIHVPEGEQYVHFRFNGAHPEEKGWLDKIEVTDSPAILTDIPKRILTGTDGITLGLGVWGPGAITYRWIKNGSELAGEDASTLLVATDSFTASDRFQMVVTSEFGETRSKPFHLTPVEEIVDTHGLAINFGGDSHWEQNLQEQKPNSLKVTLKPEESTWLEFEVSGPAVVSYDGRYSTALIDGEATPSLEWWGPGSERRDYISVPTDSHTVRLAFGAQPDDSASRTMFISDLVISDSLLILSEDPLATNGVAEYRLNTAVYMAGERPLTVKWFKDGELVKESSNVHDYYSRFFDDTGPQKDPEDTGTYYCEITDANGVARRSDDFVVNLVDTREIGDVIGDAAYKLCDSYTPWFYDTENFVEGDSSAYTTIPKLSRIGWIQFCTEEFQNELDPAAEVSLKLSGFDEGTVVKLDGGGYTQLLELTEEWQTIELARGSNIININIEKSASSELRVWIDGLERNFDLRVVDQPQHFASYLNGEASFSVEAFSAGSVSYQWRHNGAAIPGAHSNTFQIDEILAVDLGTYDVVVRSNGKSVISEPAQLSIVDDLGVALEAPGLKVRTWGDALWSIDDSVSIDGTGSLRSGDINSGESSYLEIEFEFPGMYSVYEHYEPANGEVLAWGKYNDFSPELPFKVEFRVTLEDGETNRDDYTRFMRLDRLSFSALAGFSYEEWRKRISTLTGDPLVSDSLFDDLGDTDGDRVSNFLEYLFDLDPLNRNKLPQLKFNVIDGQIIAGLSYRFAADGESTVRFELSDDLDNWYLMYPDTVQSLSSEGDYYQIESTAIMPRREQGSTFIRWSTIRKQKVSSPIEVNSQ